MKAVNPWKSETNAILWPVVRVWRNLRFFQEDWNIRCNYISIRLHGWSSITAWMRSSRIIVSDGNAKLMWCYSTVSNLRAQKILNNGIDAVLEARVISRRCVRCFLFSISGLLFYILVLIILTVGDKSILLPHTMQNKSMNRRHRFQPWKTFV